LKSVQGLAKKCLQTRTRLEEPTKRSSPLNQSSLLHKRNGSRTCSEDSSAY
jgi:hypothetical protein